MSCCDGFDFSEDVIGECTECGGPIDEEGYATEGCFYSPIVCDTCQWAPCDGSC